MLFLTVAILLVLIVLFVCYGKWKLQYWTRKGVLQLEPNFVFGDTKPLLTGSKSVQDYFQEIYKAGRKKSAKHLGIYNFWTPEFIPIDLSLVKRILATDYTYFDTHGAYHSKSDKFSENLFTLEGSEWKDRRSKMTPTFTPGKMKMMFNTLLEKTNELKKAIDRESEANQEVAIKELMARFTTDVIASIAFGLECNSLGETNNVFREIGMKAFTPSAIKFFAQVVLPSSIAAKLGGRFASNEVESYFTKIVKDTISYRESNNIERKDFIQILLSMKQSGNMPKDKNKLTEQEIINESYLFYLVGFESSSSTVTFAILELAQQPYVQQKLREEVTENFKKHNGFTYEGIAEMGYLDKIVKETIRKYPAIAFYPRACTKTYKVPGTDVVIEKGTKVHISVIGIHHDPEYFPNPEEFDPERFTPENIAKRPDYSFLPYGEGPKQCLGMRFADMQVKVAIATVIKDYKLTIDKKTQLPLQLNPSSFTFSLKKDVMLKVTKV